ncbi:UNVERIFIED_CONTAM: hypothetical protein PYX00_001754 [Menopon gallinae]|uniref:Uncharacterized protein n=1 Tax=Menopon gallinae TaxID=328185 RepID=A0AAW2IE40_9NEOP
MVKNGKKEWKQKVEHQWKQKRNGWRVEKKEEGLEKLQKLLLKTVMAAIYPGEGWVSRVLGPPCSSIP